MAYARRTVPPLFLIGGSVTPPPPAGRARWGKSTPPPRPLPSLVFALRTCVRPALAPSNCSPARKSRAWSRGWVWVWLLARRTGKAHGFFQGLGTGSLCDEAKGWRGGGAGLALGTLQEVSQSTVPAPPDFQKPPCTKG